jgi:hypothetical protein
MEGTGCTSFLSRLFGPFAAMAKGHKRAIILILLLSIKTSVNQIDPQPAKTTICQH